MFSQFRVYKLADCRQRQSDDDDDDNDKVVNDDNDDDDDSVRTRGARFRHRRESGTAN